MVERQVCGRLDATVDCCGRRKVAIPCTESRLSCIACLEGDCVPVDGLLCNRVRINGPRNRCTGNRISVRCNDSCSYRHFRIRCLLGQDYFLCRQPDEGRNRIAGRNVDDFDRKRSFLVIVVGVCRYCGRARLDAGDCSGCGDLCHSRVGACPGNPCLGSGRDEGYRRCICFRHTERNHLIRKLKSFKSDGLVAYAYRTVCGIREVSLLYRSRNSCGSCSYCRDLACIGYSRHSCVGACPFDRIAGHGTWVDRNGELFASALEH